MNQQQVITELQTKGLNLVVDAAAGERAGNWASDLASDLGVSGRKGGAGPSDHKAVTVGKTTVMVPVYTTGAAESPYAVRQDKETGKSTLTYNGKAVAPIDFPRRPRFYQLKTANGVPYWKIALLHSHNVLATTVLQRCIRYDNRTTACQFCAIGQSLEADRTIAQKTPQQLAEVAPRRCN